MAINQNHQFEELNGVKCAIVEKNASPARVDFLRRLLEYNGYTVVAVPSPPPKAAPAASSPARAAAGSSPAAAAAPAAASAPAPTAAPPPAAASAPTEATAPAPVPPAPETFTVGVTNVMFNPINAIFGRLLKTPDGHTVTLAYWHQKETGPDDERPYFDCLVQPR